ncbi:MAG: hypothetical protein MRY79_08285 [Alphaproteobacteria bacterium]|nr:hypothetical protein [Alphaproteobacteria bacterium]
MEKQTPDDELKLMLKFFGTLMAPPLVALTTLFYMSNSDFQHAQKNAETAQFKISKFRNLPHCYKESCDSSRSDIYGKILTPLHNNAVCNKEERFEYSIDPKTFDYLINNALEPKTVKIGKGPNFGTCYLFPVK